MQEIACENKDGRVVITLPKQVDSRNSTAIQEQISDYMKDKEGMPVLLDAEEMNYISSAGLRILLRMKTNNPDMTICNVCSEVYEILEMTGFTEMLEVERAYRRISIEGCEEIGRGESGVIYRISEDNVVKVYKSSEALEAIRHEREVAKLALILGIPTAISYEIVHVGDHYGSVFELLNARSFSKILATEPEKMEWCVREFVNMLKKIHNTEVPAGKLPNMKETALKWATFVKEHIPAAAGEKLLALIRALPENEHLIHGDYHTKNLELQGDEVLLIDMDTLAVGHPVFEFASMYNAFVGFSEYNNDQVRQFQGFDLDTSKLFWRKALMAYLGTKREELAREVEDKARIIGYTRLIRRSIRHGDCESEAGKEELALWKRHLLELLDKTDTLDFTRYEIELDALRANYPAAQQFVRKHIHRFVCSSRVQMWVDIAVEELFVNIATYAYGEKKGKVILRLDPDSTKRKMRITFIDRGTPFDPWARKDPDVTLRAEERSIGGLGIYMTKKMMDAVGYEYEDGRNISWIEKKF